MRKPSWGKEAVLRNRVYYLFKPFIPARTRLTLRRWWVRRQLQRGPCLDGKWPIMAGSERSPDGWAGWPGGRRFALVLTHDVESEAGLRRCRDLMELEKKHGFRSSFNFIPEGPYRVPRALIDDLHANGFEVGVHDLQHDGKLYRNRREFSRKASRINHYLREWGASGFRSGFMLRRLDWLHELDVEYDASTFDTDPFEPQPDGVGTIFPFWVANPEAGAGRKGYVSLPYTLPQDSTLFLFLQEQHIGIWRHKLDWIADQGGMALLNTHPDYMTFGGGGDIHRTYPAEKYEEFLKYVKTQHGEQMWSALPREVAENHRQRPPHRPATRPRRVAMLAYSIYESDQRVMRYAEALAARGDAVEALALKRDVAQADVEMIGEVRVCRIQARGHKNERSKAAFLFPILRFWLLASIRLAREHFRRRYDVIHVHNVPDFLVFAAWLPRILGTKLILDIHDIVPEFYASKFSLAPDSLGVRLLKLVERLSARFADRVIISNHLWKERLVERSRCYGKCSVFINNVDEVTFRPRPRRRGSDGKLIILFPGGLQWHQGLDIALHAFRQLLDQLPQAEFHIYGDGNMKGRLMALAVELGLGSRVQFFDPRPVRQIAEIMADADLGVVPKRADSFGNEAYSTKIMEFMSVGVPVVISSTRIDRYYFNESVVRFFESGNADAMAKAMVEVLTDASGRAEMVERASRYAVENSWETRKHDYLALVDSMLTQGTKPGQPAVAAASLPEDSTNTGASKA